MSNTLKTILIVIGTIISGAVLLLVGINIGQASIFPGPMMAAYSPNTANPVQGSYQYPMGPGMMGSFSFGDGSNLDPLSLSEAEEVVEQYLANLGDSDLALGEVMIFDNHAYAQIVEKETGTGAMEVLIDPASFTVYPEHGPNMMWNLKYSPMAGHMGFGGRGMMGGYNYGRRGNMMGYVPGTDLLGAEMPISPEEAVEAAQAYLDANSTGFQADEHADPFYGYFTLHTLKDGQTAGMLSVNGYSGEVFPHTWHGEFVEMTESE